MKRKLAFIAILFSVCCSACLFNRHQAKPAAAPGPVSVKLGVDRPDGVFKSGETATFTVEAAGAVPTAGFTGTYNIVANGMMPPFKSGKFKIKDRPGKITAKLDKPGSVICTVRMDGPTTAPQMIGAIFDPFQIKPSMPAPADFDEFWNKEKGLLAGDYTPEITPMPSSDPKVDLFHVKIPMPEGRPVQGYLAKPKGAAAKSLGVIARTHGAGVRSSYLPGVVGWASRFGLMAFDFNAHGIDDGMPKDYYANLENGELKNYRTDGIESRETVYFRGMFKRLLRAIDFLTKQPEWDGKTLIVYGGSQGGAQAIVAAGLDDRVSCIVAAYPALCDLTGIKAGRTGGWPHPIAIDKDGKYDERVLEAVRYYDCVNFAARIKADTFMMEGLIDTTCHPTSVLPAYNALQSKTKQIDIVANKPHNSLNGKEGRDAEKFVMDHVARMKGATQK